MTSVQKYLFLFLMMLEVTGVKGLDSLKVSPCHTFQVIDYRNPWSGTENIAGLVFNPATNLADVNLGMDFGNGDFHRIMDPSNVRNYSLSTRSYKKIGNFYLFGNFAYHNLQEKGSRWNGTFDPYCGNPYIIGDSVSNSIYRKEKYLLSGGIATTLNKKITLGCKINYFAGIGAKQKDPRPENTVIQFMINPGIIWHKAKYNLGLDLGILNRKEEISYIQNITDNPDPTFFFFKGFGFYAREVGTDFSRFQDQTDYFGGVQLENTCIKKKMVSEIRFRYSRDQINDGRNLIIKQNAGDWDVINVKINETAIFGTSARMHKLLFSADFRDGNGTEFTQDKVYKGNLAEYVTIASNLKFNRRTYAANLRYEYLTLTEAGNPDWSVGSGLDFTSNDETYYYIPEIFNASFSNLTGNVRVEKYFYQRKLFLAPGVSATYVQNLQKDLLLSDLTEITKKQMKDVYTHDFNFFSGNRMQFNIQLMIGQVISGKKYQNRVYMSLDYSLMKSIALSTNFSLLAGKIGFTF